MDITTQQSTVALFRRWFEGGNAHQGQGRSLKMTIEDNRRRYRMILADAETRNDLGLSALPSTKSTSVVDNAVIDAIQEYYQTDAITFTAADDSDAQKEDTAKWFREIFKTRAKKNGFWVWHLQSLKCGMVDGIEAGMVRWRHETYNYTEKHYYNAWTGQEISEQEYKAAKKAGPIILEGAFDPATGKPKKIRVPFEKAYQVERTKKKRVVADTWEVLQLKPGENLLWDFKNPLLDLNRGQWCIVITNMPQADIMNLAEEGIFDKITPEELKPYQTTQSNSSNQSNYVDRTSLATDPDTVDMGEFNTVEVWMAFERKGNQWMVTFSLAGQKELAAEQNVNDVFFGGRPFDRLPVVMGASDIELWEALGRGMPKLIAPIEDELTDHRNNANDMAKQAATGKYMIKPDSDVDINSLLNDKFFFAGPGEVQKLDYAAEMAVVMRAGEQVNGDIASLVPVTISDNQLVGRGNARDTLGSVQMAVGGNDKKLSARLLIRNITFLEPILRVAAEMSMAFETDQKIGKAAGKAAKIDMTPMTTVIDGEMAIDFTHLDFDAEIGINAGLGTVPIQLKVQKLMQYTEWAKAHGIPLDIEEVDKQLKILNGFNEEQFILPPEKRQQPEPPPVEDTLVMNVTFQDLLAYAPEAAMALLNKAVGGTMQIKTNIKDKPEPGYLKEPAGSPSHPAMLQHHPMQAPQGEMGPM